MLPGHYWFLGAGEPHEPHGTPLPAAKVATRAAARMEAPLVSLEEEFEESPGGGGSGGGPPRGLADPALAELESFSAEMMSFKSMEDLVQEFDEKLTVCFRNYDAATEALAPVRGRLQAQEEEERLQDEEVWDALTESFAPHGSPRRWLLPDTEAPDDADPQRAHVTNSRGRGCGRAAKPPQKAPN